jgi:hypothetical protein
VALNSSPPRFSRQAEVPPFSIPTLRRVIRSDQLVAGIGRATQRYQAPSETEPVSGLPIPVRRRAIHVVRPSFRPGRRSVEYDIPDLPVQPTRPASLVPGRGAGRATRFLDVRVLCRLPFAPANRPAADQLPSCLMTRIPRRKTQEGRLRKATRSGTSRAANNPQPLFRGVIEQDSRSVHPASPVVSVATRKGGQ